MAEAEVRLLSSNAKMRSLRVGNVYVVRWCAPPDVDIIRLVARQVEAEAGASSTLIYCGISDSSVGTNHSDEVKKALLQGTAEMAKRCAEFHIVMAGDSVGARLTRSTYRALVAGVRVTGKVLNMDLSKHVHKVEIHESSESFLKKLETKGRQDAVQVRRAFTEHKMFEDS